MSTLNQASVRVKKPNGKRFRTIPQGTILEMTVDLINSSGYRIDYLAECAGVTDQCLYNWINGTVTHPRMSNVQRVLEALGYQLQVVHIGTKH